jgi:MFS transporter, CP family, cyanate transporter
MQRNNSPADADRQYDDQPAGVALPPASRLLLAVALLLVGVNLRPALTSASAVLAAIRADTGMSAAAAGMLTTLPVLCFGLFAAFAPWLARRYSAERVVLYSLLILALGTGLRIFFGASGLFIGALVAGASIGIMMVLLPSIVKREFPDRVGLMMGAYTMALCLGAALAAGVTVPIQNLAGGDWRSALAFWMLPALIAAVVWWPQMRHHARQNGQERYVVRGLRSSVLAWQVTAYMGLQSVLAYCVFGWLPAILIDRGMSPLDAGFVLSASIGMQLITALAGPWLATRGKDQCIAIALLMIMSLAGLLGCMYAPLDAIWRWAILLGLGQGGSFSIAMTLLVLRAPNAHVTASLSGMAQGFGYSFAALGPLVAGVLHDLSHGWDTVAVFLTAVGIAALIVGVGAGRNLLIKADVDRLG